jgi:hypothetical protein
MAFQNQNWTRITADMTTDNLIDSTTGIVSKEIGLAGSKAYRYLTYGTGVNPGVNDDTINTCLNTANYFSAVADKLGPGDTLEIIDNSVPAAGTGYINGFIRLMVASSNVKTGVVTFSQIGIAESTTILTAAQVLAMNGATQTLIPAFTNFAILVQAMAVRLNWIGGTQYANGGVITGRIGASDVTAQIPAANILTNAIRVSIVPGIVAQVADATINTAMGIRNGTAPFANGTSTLTVSTNYTLL